MERENEAYIDGSSAGMYGYILGEKTFIVYDSNLTNNQAEWLALYSLLVDLPRYSSVTVYSDSQLVVNQWSGEFKCKNEELLRIKNACKRVASLKKLKIDLKWIPREKNIFGKKLEKELAKKRKERWDRRNRR